MVSNNGLFAYFGETFIFNEHPLLVTNVVELIFLSLNVKAYLSFRFSQDNFVFPFHFIIKLIFDDGYLVNKHCLSIVWQICVYHMTLSRHSANTFDRLSVHFIPTSCWNENQNLWPYRIQHLTRSALMSTNLMDDIFWIEVADVVVRSYIIMCAFLVYPLCLHCLHSAIAANIVTEFEIVIVLSVCFGFCMFDSLNGVLCGVCQMVIVSHLPRELFHIQ